MTPEIYKVRKGDTLSGIAKRFKHKDWKTIWLFEHKLNKAVRKARKVPEKIEPGDELAIPPTAAEKKAAAAAQANETALAEELNALHALLLQTATEIRRAMTEEARAGKDLAGFVKTCQGRVGKLPPAMLGAELGALSAQIQARAGTVLAQLAPVLRAAELSEKRALGLGKGIAIDRKNKDQAKGCETLGASWKPIADMRDALRALGGAWSEIADMATGGPLRTALKAARIGGEAARPPAIAACAALLAALEGKCAKLRGKLDAAASGADAALKKIKAARSAAIKRAREMPVP